MTDPNAPAYLLRLDSVSGGYGQGDVVRSVSATVAAGQIVTVLGANGAGKTTLLRLASGLLKATEGRIFVNDADVRSLTPTQRARRGLCLVPEGRGVFRSLTVRENLDLQIPPWLKGRSIDPALEAFPVLRSHLGQVAGTLSGGEQQMLALSRPFLCDASVVLLDEVSMGLSPIVLDDVFDAMLALAARGIALLVVEQYVDRILAIADFVYVLERGSVAIARSSSDTDADEVLEKYLGAVG